jgi:hypothetical protein
MWRLYREHNSWCEDVLRFANAHLTDGSLSESWRRLLFTEQQTLDGGGALLA